MCVKIISTGTKWNSKNDVLNENTIFSKAELSGGCMVPFTTGLVLNTPSDNLA